MWYIITAIASFLFGLYVSPKLKRLFKKSPPPAKEGHVEPWEHYKEQFVEVENCLGCGRIGKSLGPYSPCESCGGKIVADKKYARKWTVVDGLAQWVPSEHEMTKFHIEE